MTAMGDFAADTAVEGRDGQYRACLSRDWEIWGPNGGYAAAIALRAVGAAAALRRPASFTCHFLSVADFDVVDLQVTALRHTKRAASLRVSMTQKDRPIVDAIAWVVAEGTGLEHDVTEMPAVPSPQRLKSIEDLVGPENYAPHFPFWHNLEARPIQWVPWEQRQASPPQWREWYRFRPRATFDDPFADTARAVVLVDTMLWPAACQPYVPDSGYVAPSLDVTVHFHRAAPASEWLFCDAAAPVARDGLIGGQAHIWSEDGQLLASGGGQLLCRPRPAP
jgi:acyl-CoA thioesterase II